MMSPRSAQESPATVTETHEVKAALAQPENVSEYVAERHVEEKAEQTGDPVKRASRYERLKRARDAEIAPQRMLLGSSRVIR